MEELTTQAPPLRDQITVGPDIDIESWRLKVPAKAGCFCLYDDADRPIVLGTAASLRAAMLSRLDHPESEEPTRRTDYRAVTRRVAWHRACSRFEADWLYLEHVRALFPKTYAPLIKRWRAHWVTIDPDQSHPRFAASQKPAPNGLAFGPFATAVSARQVVETCLELFDLCRYHEVLLQSPNGKPCAYKEMGKCPAPCDGTVTMDHYHSQIADAVAFCHRPQDHIDTLQQRMETASAELAFEDAARCKAGIDLATKLTGTGFKLWGPLERMRWLTIQAGSRKGAARLFVITPGSIGFVGEIQPKQLDEQVEWVTPRLDGWLNQPIEPMRGPAVERLGLVCWHLMRGDNRQGVWLRHERGIDAGLIRWAIDKVNDRKDSAEIGAGHDSADAESDAPNSGG